MHPATHPTRAIPFPASPAGRRTAAAFLLGAGCLGVMLGCSSGGGGDGANLGPGGGGHSGGAGVPLVIQPVVEVRNQAATARTATMLASVPFPEGMIQNLDHVGVSGRATSWMPMETWPDGSVRVAQAQFTDDFDANEVKNFTIVQDVQPLSGAFQPNPWVNGLAGNLRFKVQVKDTHNARYVAEINGLDGDVVHQTPLVKVTHSRVYHEPIDSNSIGRDYLSSQFYVYQFRDQPFLVVDWILGNDYLGKDDPGGSSDPNLFPLGGVDVNDAMVEFRGMTEVQPHLPQMNDITALSNDQGWTRFRVMQNDYIDDAQTRRYRFLLRFESAGAPAEEIAKWQDSFTAMVDKPLRPLADLDTWQKSQALNLHGGPITGPSDGWQRAQNEFNSWSGRDQFGTWGSFGDTINTGTAGTPRNAPASPEIMHAIQSRNPLELEILEQKAWMQAIRPYHLYGLQVGAEQKILLYSGLPFAQFMNDPTVEGLGRRTVWNNDPWPGVRTRSSVGSHGYNAYDENHWSTDLLFDYWTVSGDCWAREELRNLGQSLKGMLRLQYFATSNIRCARCEGWSMVGFVQTYLATGDESIKQFALRRIEEIVNVQRETRHPARFIKQMGPDPRSGMGSDVTFYPPWEHGSIMYGYLGAYKYFGSETALTIAEDVITSIDYAWISNYTHPVTGQHYDNAVRYWVPAYRAGQLVPANLFDNDPTRGALIPSGGGLRSVNMMLVGGVYLVAHYTQNPTVRNRALWQGQTLLPIPVGDDDRWDKWYSVFPPDYEDKLRGGN